MVEFVGWLFKSLSKDIHQKIKMWMKLKNLECGTSSFFKGSLQKKGEYQVQVEPLKPSVMWKGPGNAALEKAI